MYKDNMDGLSVINHFALVATPGQRVDDKLRFQQDFTHSSLIWGRINVLTDVKDAMFACVGRKVQELLEKLFTWIGNSLWEL